MPEPRPSQQEVLRYRDGKMGVSAVPGSGKTFTLARLAADLVVECIHDDQEVLIVTLVNSAVDNVSGRIDALLGERGLIPRLGYRVRTLHGLAHDIVRERPGLVDLSEDFQIIDDRESTSILEECCDSWLKTHPEFMERYVKHDMEGGRWEWIQKNQWPETLRDVMSAFIRQAKDQQASPELLWSRLKDRADELPLAAAGASIYINYQQALMYRGSVDFDDLMRLALAALRLDADYLQRLQDRWVYILEDEAQDSSELQERILRTLAGERGNWVRVGDPNQAIFETFTTASPEFLRNFLDETGVARRDLPESGRSCQAIIDLANRLIKWVKIGHPVVQVRGSLDEPYIRPAPPGDSQPNPLCGPDAIRIVEEGFSADDEIVQAVAWADEWRRRHPNETSAILVPRNMRGFKVAEALRAKGVPCVELLQSTASTRQTAGVLGNVLRYLADPTSASKLADAFRAWRRRDREEQLANTRLKQLVKVLRQCRLVEDYLWPQLDADWLDTLSLQDADAGELVELLRGFRGLVRRWQEAVLLPIDQLLLTVAQDLFDEPVDLALAYKLALVLRDVADTRPEWGLAEFTDELAVIARNQRKFLGMSADDTAFDPNNYPGHVLVATMHKAKGLEWDRVHLLSVSNYDFPSAQSYDQYIGEKWFVRDSLNLEAECLRQLEAGLGDETYEEGEATQQARFGYVAERLRLLFVGITRARKELVVTWNKGSNPQRPAREAVPLIGLLHFRDDEAGATPEGVDDRDE